MTACAEKDVTHSILFGRKTTQFSSDCYEGTDIFHHWGYKLVIIFLIAIIGISCPSIQNSKVSSKRCKVLNTRMYNGNVNVISFLFQRFRFSSDVFNISSNADVIFYSQRCKIIYRVELPVLFFSFKVFCLLQRFPAFVSKRHWAVCRFNIHF